MSEKQNRNEAQCSERRDFVNQQLEQIPVSDLVFYSKNSRTHSSEQVAQIAGSIQEFGFCNPVLIDAENSIIAGHGRVLAATRLKLETVPCIRLSHLTDAQKRAYVIADNRLALNAGWDIELLANELSDLHADDFDMSLLGFDPDELSNLMEIKDVQTESPKREVTGSLVTCPRCQFEFDSKQSR